MSNVLITGGSGFIGSHLSKLLLENKHNVAHLTRQKIKKDNTLIKKFYWNTKEKSIDTEALLWADCIINLAGAGIADKRWTKERKQELYASRVDSLNIIFNNLKDLNHHVKTLISSSGIGFYGDTGDEIKVETDSAGNDFMSLTAIDWEKSALQFNAIIQRVCIFRTGVVLGKEAGALPELARPVKLYAGAPLGTGNQYISWIHIYDLCRLYLMAVEDNQMNGIYNAVSSKPVTNKEFTTILAKVLKKPLFLPPIPGFLLKLFLGEMADTVLMSSRISNKKLKETGFNIQYDDLEGAIKNIYNKS